MIPWVQAPVGGSDIGRSAIYGQQVAGLPYSQAERALLLEQLASSKQPGFRFPSNVSRLHLANLEAQMARRNAIQAACLQQAVSQMQQQRQQRFTPGSPVINQHRHQDQHPHYHPATLMAPLPAVSRLVTPGNSLPNSPNQGLELLRSVSLNMGNNTGGGGAGVNNRRDLANLLPSAPLMQGSGGGGGGISTPDRHGSPMSFRSTNTATGATMSSPNAANTASRNNPHPNRLYLTELREWDVLCGRGGRSNHHSGNKRYRHVVSEMKLMYRNTEAKAVKTDLSRAIVEHVCNYGGRFIKKDEELGRYFVLTKAEARKKTSQALRETKELKWTI